MLIIKYSKKRLRGSLYIGLAFIVISLISFLFNLEQINYIISIPQIAMGGILLLVYFYEKNYQYLTFNQGKLTKNRLFSKPIELSEVISIKKFAGEYILELKNRKFIISIDSIDQDSIIDLQNELMKLDVKWK